MHSDGNGNNYEGRSTPVPGHQIQSTASFEQAHTYSGKTPSLNQTPAPATQNVLDLSSDRTAEVTETVDVQTRKTAETSTLNTDVVIGRDASVETKQWNMLAESHDSQQVDTVKTSRETASSGYGDPAVVRGSAAPIALAQFSEEPFHRCVQLSQTVDQLKKESMCQQSELIQESTLADAATITTHTAVFGPQLKLPSEYDNNVQVELIPTATEQTLQMSLETENDKVCDVIDPDLYSDLTSSSSNLIPRLSQPWSKVHFIPHRKGK